MRLIRAEQLAQGIIVGNRPQLPGKIDSMSLLLSSRKWLRDTADLGTFTADSSHSGCTTPIRAKAWWGSLPWQVNRALEKAQVGDASSLRALPYGCTNEDAGGGSFSVAEEQVVDCRQKSRTRTHRGHAKQRVQGHAMLLRAHCAATRTEATLRGLPGLLCGQPRHLSSVPSPRLTTTKAWQYPQGVSSSLHELQANRRRVTSQDKVHNASGRASWCCAEQRSIVQRRVREVPEFWWPARWRRTRNLRAEHRRVGRRQKQYELVLVSAFGS